MVTTKVKKKGWLEIKNSLIYCSENDLKGLIKDLYKLNTENKVFLETKFLNDAESLEHYKAAIKKYLSPHEPWKKSQQINLKEAKKQISLYTKATSDPLKVIDLMVYYVECGTDFLCTFGDMYEQYYTSLEDVFESIIKKMERFDNVTVNQYVDRLEVVVQKAKNTGWGYYDTISYMLLESYSPD